MRKLNSLAVTQPSLGEAADIMEELDNNKGRGPNGSVISQRVRIQMDKVEAAVAWWKPIYFGITADGRLLSGIEAYDLGDDKLQDKPDKGPYIAMCNLMALEALNMMGDSWPTVATPTAMVNGSDREKAVADFWKKTFAPTLFQASWAWSAVMAVMAGNPEATSELLYKYKDQLSMIVTL